MGKTINILGLEIVLKDRKKERIITTLDIEKEMKEQEMYRKHLEDSAKHMKKRIETLDPNRFTEDAVVTLSIIYSKDIKDVTWDDIRTVEDLCNKDARASYSKDFRKIGFKDAE